MNAGILTIGDELLGGYVIDTNSAWLARQLQTVGILVSHKASVGDSQDGILSVLAQWDGELDYIIITGGLGPTHDDITKAALCHYFDSSTAFDQAYWEKLVARFNKRGYNIPDNNRSQAEIPDKCETIPNEVGTALGLKFASAGTTFIALPGVPREMKAMVTDHLLGTIHAADMAVRTLHVAGIYESALGERLAPIIDGSTKVRISILTDVIGVDVRIYAVESGPAGAGAVNEVTRDLEAELGDAIFAYEDDTMAMTVGNLLKARGETVALAESCTSGQAASWLTDEAGASQYFLGGVVAYSNDAKESLLGVAHEAILARGAVSEQVAIEMAIGARKTLNADWGVSSTGISGPNGGSEEKPVGLAYLGLSGPKVSRAIKVRLIPDRIPHKRATAQAMLNLLRMELLNGV